MYVLMTFVAYHTHSIQPQNTQNLNNATLLTAILGSWNHIAKQLELGIPDPKTLCSILGKAICKNIGQVSHFLGASVDLAV